MILGYKIGFEFSKITNSQHVIQWFFQINDGTILRTFFSERVSIRKKDIAHFTQLVVFWNFVPEATCPKKKIRHLWAYQKNTMLNFDSTTG